MSGAFICPCPADGLFPDGGIQMGVSRGIGFAILIVVQRFVVLFSFTLGFRASVMLFRICLVSPLLEIAVSDFSAIARTVQVQRWWMFDQMDQRVEFVFMFTCFFDRESVEDCRN